MKTELEHRLQQFVNRENEMQQFCNMLDRDEKPVLVICGDSGIGKSSLLARMIHECAMRKLEKSEIVWTPTRNHDYMYIMRKIRDDVGVEYFSKFTDLINYFTSTNYELKIKVESDASIEIGRGARFTKTDMGDMAGVIVKDLNITAPRTDRAIPEEERMRRLTDQFIEDLAGALKDKPLLVFFDAIEKMTAETEAWVSNEFLGALRQGRLTNIRFVLCGQRKPSDIDEWLWMAEEAELKPLEREYIVEYLAKKGIDESNHDALTDMLLVMTKGYADRVAKAVEAFLKMQEKRSNG